MPNNNFSWSTAIRPWPEVDGYVGNFKVKVKKKARYIDTDACTGCGLCTEACGVRKVPMRAPRELEDELNRCVELLRERALTGEAA